MAQQNSPSFEGLEIFTNSEAARFLRISTITLWRLRKKRLINYRRISSKIAYTIDDLNQYLDSTKQEAN